MSATVTAPAGRIEGIEAEGVRRFLGIPYAAAPVGALRFAAPEPLAPFAEPFEALRHGATPQRVPLFAKTTIPEPSIPGAATLNLDLFAPPAGAGHPVLFWIHGGGYLGGSAASPWYDGSAFAREGVVVVNASYRLGVDGFGVLPGAPDNRGLRDLVQALHWVRENIAAFGGDPARVTIAGQSAGGGCVLALLSSPAATGLFRAALSVSGVDISIDEGSARAATVAVAEALGVPATAAGFGPEDDGAATRAILRMRGIGTRPMFAPVHGGDLLPQPITSGLAVRGLGAPLLMGATADEFDGGPTPENPDRPGPDDAEVRAAKAAGRRVTDTLFRAVCPRTARARSGGATWLYSFEWPSPVTHGATHCIDVPFLFGNLGAKGTAEALGQAPPSSLERAMHGDVLAFVCGKEPGWSPATGIAGDAARLYDASGEAVTAQGAFDPVLRGADRGGA